MLIKEHELSTINSKSLYEVCSKNTRTVVIKMYFIWKLHVWVPFKVLSSQTHTLIPTDPEEHTFELQSPL